LDTLDAERDEVRELHRLAMRDVGAMFARAPGFHAWIEPDAAFLVSGEPVIDLNMLLIGPTPRAVAVLETAHETAVARGLPFVAFVAPAAADAVAPTAARLGLASAGTVPMMVFRADGPLPLGKACDVVRAADPAQATSVGGLVSAAFGLDRASTARTLDTAIHPTSGVDVYIGAMNGAPLSTVTVTRAGDTAGVWCMATPPEHQGKGAGRALLTRVMEAQRQAGVRRFYLFATPAGQPLYESIGYETLAQCPAWAFAPEGAPAH
jgi:GNAT superfamily N-acetyltransferase